jgi:integrase
LQPIIGKQHLLKSLRTRDKTVARSRKHAALAEFEAILNRARQQAGSGSIMDAALAWRQTVQRLSAGDLSGFSVHPPPAPGTNLRSFALNLADDDIERSADEIAATHSPAIATAFYGVATGTATPLLHHMEAWLLEGGRKGPLGARTRSQYRSFVTGFSEWCSRVGIPATVEAVTKAVAGRFITEEFVARGIEWRTSNAHISALSTYWRWMVRRVGIELNPWQGQSMAKPSARHGDGNSKRPFTDDEMVTLLTGGAKLEMDDAIRVAALSGMRLEEIYRLKVRDCTERRFNIRRAKTAAGVRTVPIHPDLGVILERRTRGKAPNAYLFEEAGDVPPGRVRSGRLSARFTKYRQSVGVHDKDHNRRHSRVDFHSLRRWFVTKARQAGIDRAVVAATVGHEVGNLTDDTYSGGPSLEQRRACVEAVKLPKITNP